VKALKTDVKALKTSVDALKTSVDMILAREEKKNLKPVNQKRKSQINKKISYDFLNSAINREKTSKPAESILENED